LRLTRGWIKIRDVGKGADQVETLTAKGKGRGAGRARLTQTYNQTASSQTPPTLWQPRLPLQAGPSDVASPLTYTHTHTRTHARTRTHMYTPPTSWPPPRPAAAARPSAAAAQQSPAARGWRRGGRGTRAPRAAGAGAPPGSLQGDKGGAAKSVSGLGVAAALPSWCSNQAPRWRGGSRRPPCRQRSLPGSLARAPRKAGPPTWLRILSYMIKGAAPVKGSSPNTHRKTHTPRAHMSIWGDQGGGRGGSGGLCGGRAGS
jgi:hypothetical protein